MQGYTENYGEESACEVCESVGQASALLAEIKSTTSDCMSIRKIEAVEHWIQSICDVLI